MDENDIFQALSAAYVIRADERQKAMGLSYVAAETSDLARFIHKLIDSHRLAAEQSGWRDIADAPYHDGAKIIGYDPKWGVAEMMRDGSKKWVLAAFNGVARYCQPTHWRPLPSPPATPTNGGGE